MSVWKRPRHSLVFNSAYGKRIVQRTDVETPFSPRMNLYEQDSMNMMTATFKLPGLKREDVTIDFLHDTLTISGEIADPKPEGEGVLYTSRELPFGNFSRELTIPLGTRPEDFKAQMENGLLTITFPSEPPKQTPHRIPIK